MSEEEQDSRSSMETDQQPTPEKKQEDQKNNLQNTEEDKGKDYWTHNSKDQLSHDVLSIEETVQNGEEETVENGVKDVNSDTQVPAIPDYKTQKLEIHPLLSHKLKSGDHW